MKKINLLFVVLSLYTLIMSTTTFVLADTNQTELILFIEKEENTKKTEMNGEHPLPKTGEKESIETVILGVLICTVSAGLFLRKTQKDSKTT